MVKRGSTGSGGYDFYCGWINVLFPFMGNTKKNVYCVPYSIEHAYVQQGMKGKRYLHGSHGQETGGDVNKYPTGMSSAAVVWKYHGQQIDMKLIAGFVGYQQDPKTLEICPNLGWCIAR